MKTTVIHHSADFDGLFCREIARKFLPNAELIGWDFKDEPLAIPDGQIYIMDLPVDRVFGWKFTGQSSSSLLTTGLQVPMGFFSRTIWIDHHKSAIETHPTNIPGYRIDGVAACRLAWQWFLLHEAWDPRELHPPYELPSKQDFTDRRVSEPLAVRLAGEYDIWDKRDPHAELFQHGLRSQELTETVWTHLLSMNGVPMIERLLEGGKVLQFSRANEYRDVIAQQGFTVQFEGLTFLACNSHELDIRSHLFEAGIKPEHDALLGFTYNGVSKDWRVSMYHAPGKENHDLSLIAVKHGGGGHRGACGFRTTELPFLK